MVKGWWANKRGGVLELQRFSRRDSYLSKDPILGLVSESFILGPSSCLHPPMIVPADRVEE